MKAREVAMKRWAGVAGAAGLAAAIAGSGAAAEEKLQKLTSAQIRAKLAGMELSDHVHWRDFYERSGRVTSSSMGRKRNGKWHVAKDELCVEFEHEPPAKCYEVWLSGKNVELRREGTLPLAGVIEPPSGRK
jgi:hypothetical protein